MPWTADNVGEASKRELVEFLQANCSAKFLSKHELNGLPQAITEKANVPTLQAIYKEVLDDPSVVGGLPRGVRIVATPASEGSTATLSFPHDPVLSRLDELRASAAQRGKEKLQQMQMQRRTVHGSNGIRGGRGASSQPAGGLDLVD